VALSESMEPHSLQRCPVVAGGLVSTYAFDGGCILPVGDAHAIVMPNERVLTTAGGSPRWYKDAKTWASAVNKAMPRAPGLRRAWRPPGSPVGPYVLVRMVGVPYQCGSNGHEGHTS
jgi:hypothetical protein